MHKAKNIAVVAHDNCKNELLDFIACNYDVLRQHSLMATGTTGGLVEDLLKELAAKTGGEKAKEVHRLKSGPLGGDQQLGAAISDGQVDVLFFFWDPHAAAARTDVDVKALLRIAVLYNIPTASNRSSAEFLISSPFFNREFAIHKMDFSSYIQRDLP